MYGIETLFVLTEPRLAKHLARLGVDIKQVGGPVEHRGTRILSIMTVASVMGGINFVIRPLYKVVAEEVRLGVRAQREMQPAVATSASY
jgi:N-acyl amino acid synthase of PEP-CTERM/exosortase system